MSSSTTYIKKCKPIALDAQPGQPPMLISFDDIIKYWLNNDARFNSDGSGIRASMRIENALDASPDVLALKTDPDYKLLLEVADKPDCRNMPAYPLSPARRCESVMSAIREGTTEKPRERKTDEAKAPKTARTRSQVNGATKDTPTE